MLLLPFFIKVSTQCLCRQPRLPLALPVPQFVLRFFTPCLLLFTLALPTANAGDFQLDEIWIGGWNSHNIIRIDWQTGHSNGMFVPAGSGGVNQPHAYSFGPDNNLYVASHGNSTVRRYDGETGEFIDIFIQAGNGLINSHSVLWNFDNTLIVCSENGDRVNQYNGVTGSFLSTFVTQGEAGLNGPEDAITGPDGFIYISAQSNQILKVDPLNGGVVEVFVGDDPGTPEDETGGLSWAHQIRFGPDGNLYVTSSQTNQVLRYDGKTGDFMDVFVSAGGGGAPSFPIGLGFGPDGNLYVTSFGSSLLQRYDGQTGKPLGTVANLGAMGLSGPLFLEFFTGPKCKSDLNQDGTVSTSDLLLLFAAWGPNQGNPADLNTDGTVNTTDLLRLFSSWGLCD